MWLLVVAALGMLLPNGLFLYWLIHDYSSLSAAFSDRLALAFVLDVFGSTALLAYLFARKPLGPVRWPWFLGLSLVGASASLSTFGSTGAAHRSQAPASPRGGVPSNDGLKLTA